MIRNHMLKILLHIVKHINYDKNTKLKNCVFNFASTDLANITSGGRAFHSFGAVEVKDLSYHQVLP